MNNLKCWLVKCRDKFGEIHSIGVMCNDEESAKKCAEKSLLDSKNLESTAFEVAEAENI